MPLPRYVPGSGNLGAAQPIADEVGGAYNKGANIIDHPIDAIRGMLGMPLAAPVQAPTTDPTWHNQMVDKANQSFQPQNQAPRRMMPKR
jgi:hypothetical protein